MSQPLLNDVVKQIVSDCYKVDTKFYQFSHTKGIFKASVFKDIGPVVAYHLEFVNAFVQFWVHFKNDGKNFLSQIICTADGNVLPNPSLFEFATKVLVANYYPRMKFEEMSLKQAYGLMEKTEDPEQLLMTILGLSKYLLMPNPNLLRMTSTYRQMRKQPEFNDILNMVTSMMITVISIADLIVENSLDAVPDVINSDDPITITSYKRIARNLDEAPPRKIIGDLKAKISESGEVKLDQNDPFMQLYWISERIGRNFVRSLKRWMFGVGSNPNTRRIDTVKAQEKDIKVLPDSFMLKEIKFGYMNDMDRYDGILSKQKINKIV